MPIEISLDLDKRANTLKERGFDFADAHRLFDGPVITFEDDRFPYPETRYATYGWLENRIVAVIWTETAQGRRVISMRKANGREQARYRERLG